MTLALNNIKSVHPAHIRLARYAPGLTNRRLVYELPSDVDGVPDGAQCDADGCLWVALSGAGKVVRVSRTGGVDYVVELPVKCPTSVTFGGRNLDTLFITTRGPDGGSLYAVRAPPGVRGVPEVAYDDASPLLAGGAGGMVTAGAADMSRFTHGASDAEGGRSGGGRVASGVGGVVVEAQHQPGLKFCANCGTGFGSTSARFCTECGCARC